MMPILFVKQHVGISTEAHGPRINKIFFSIGYIDLQIIINLVVHYTHGGHVPSNIILIVPHCSSKHKMAYASREHIASAPPLRTWIYIKPHASHF